MIYIIIKSQNLRRPPRFLLSPRKPPVCTAPSLPPPVGRLQREREGDEGAACADAEEERAGSVLGDETPFTVLGSLPLASGTSTGRERGNECRGLVRFHTSMNESGGDHIEDHGTALDEEKKKVSCNYCHKVVGGFNRLKHHLGSLGNDVMACEGVPADVKAHMRDLLLEKKKEKLLKEVGELYHPDLPLKRNFLPKPTHPTTSDKGKNVVESAPDNVADGLKDVPLKRELSPEPSEPRSCLDKHTQSTTTGKRRKVTEPATEVDANGSAHIPCPTEDVKVDLKREGLQESALHAARCISRFLHEAGVDLSLIKFQSFQKMVDAVINCGAGYTVPCYDDIRGWILQEELKEVHGRVEQVKLSWPQTGCSILVDGWMDGRGRSFLCFFADCPEGTIFLKSVDASDADRDVDALFSLFCAVVEEVGIQHVIQVVTHVTSCYMEAAGKKLVEKHRTLFWTVSADFCIDLILKKIGMVDHVKKVLDDAKMITKFLYGHALALDLMRRHIHTRDLVRPSRLKYVAQFLTLEAMVSEKENLVNMVRSPAWNAPFWTSRGKGKAIADLVKDPLFWGAAEEIVKSTIPVVHVLCQVDGDGKIPIGSIYDSMDRAKEAIKRDLGDWEAKYFPLWNIIDDIWDNYLHSPLHSAGYYLNPRFFYSSDFFVDAEVANGLLCCIIRLVEDRQKQDLIALQLDAYRAGSGGFSEETAVDQRTKIPPALWWLLYGGCSPELQGFAIRILSQTCSGALRFRLRRSLSERLHARGWNSIERQRLSDAEFLHYNLRLWRSPLLGAGPKDSLIWEDADSWEDGFVDGEEEG
uniref:Ankyrin repeat domain-containing protein 30A n=1 Tax=Anthurium amnicola TaxID=1678845 RepID=A0A1D1XDA7_9ARAE